MVEDRVVDRLDLRPEPSGPARAFTRSLRHRRLCSLSRQVRVGLRVGRGDRLGDELVRQHPVGERLPLAGGIREFYSRPIAALGQANPAETERILVELCQKAGIPWAPPSARAAPARAQMRAEEVEAQAAALIEKQQWQGAVDALRSGEPLGPRGTNMLGRALLQLGDREGARHAFERTLASEPDNRIALRQMEGLQS